MRGFLKAIYAGMLQYVPHAIDLFYLKGLKPFERKHFINVLTFLYPQILSTSLFQQCHPVFKC